MSKRGAPGRGGKNKGYPKPSRDLNKAAAMREAVRKAIESLIAEKGGKKGPKPSALVVAALLDIVLRMVHSQ